VDFFIKNWKTTFAGVVVPLAPYVLQHYGLWPTGMALPPLDNVWPTILGLAGLGIVSKDYNVSGH
jgi:hypothetical protein